ncbi:MAG: RluA family pseudouridine synthase [Elusimicrobiota bacterium]
MKETRVTVDAGGVRLDRYLTLRFSGYSRSYFKDLIRRGLVSVDGAACLPDFRLRGGEVLSLRMGEAGWADVPFERWVIHEDRDLLVLRKPSGILTHPMGESWLQRPEAALSDSDASVAGFLVKFRPALIESGVSRCGIVHRLDRQTSGVLVTVKNTEAERSLLAAFRERRVDKVYRAVVLGDLKKTTVEAPIGRLPGRRRVRVSPWGKEASTSFTPVKTARGLSLVNAKPLTGRTHQIRAHLALLGHPVLGDPEAFGDRERERLRELGLPPPPRMMLHAYRIRFAHPRTEKKVSFTASVPKDFLVYWKAVR